MDIRRTQVHPSHHTHDEGISICECKQPTSLFQALSRLHRNRTVKLGVVQLPPKIPRQEIPPQRDHRLVDPVILFGFVDPEVLVCVNVHEIGWKRIGCKRSVQEASHDLGTLTYDRSSAVTDGQPSSFKVRSRSTRKISSARATPASPAAASPYAYARPQSTAFAPRQRAFTISVPRRIPPSIRISTCPFTAFTTSGSTRKEEGTQSSCRPP